MYEGKIPRAGRQRGIYSRVSETVGVRDGAGGDFAESKRFELLIPFGIHAFQACALDQLCELSNILLILSDI